MQLIFSVEISYELIYKDYYRHSFYMFRWSLGMYLDVLCFLIVVMRVDLYFLILLLDKVEVYRYIVLLRIWFTYQFKWIDMQSIGNASKEQTHTRSFLWVE